MPSKNIATCKQTNIQFLDTEETWDIHVDNKGYFRLYKWYKGKQYINLLHRHIYEQEFGGIPKGYIIHHVDENPMNNDLSNLRMLTRGEHSSLHFTTHGLSYNKAAYRATHKDQFTAYQDTYRAAHKEVISLNGYNYYTKNKEEINKKHRDKYAAKKLQNNTLGVN